MNLLFLLFKSSEISLSILEYWMTVPTVTVYIVFMCSQTSMAAEGTTKPKHLSDY